MHPRFAVVACAAFSLVSVSQAAAQSPFTAAWAPATAAAVAGRSGEGAGPVAPATQVTAPRPVAVEYSDAYRIRAKIHRVSSFATLPLFGTEAILGQSLYANPTQGRKDAHLAVAGAMGALFAVNTVTGVWNLVEARKDPVRRKRRLLHGLLLLGADAGFLATAALGPESEHGEAEGSRGAHRAVAFTSIGLATAGYLVMILGGD
jgi:hypothetical protein